MGVHSTYRGAGGISEHLILWPVLHVAGTHGNPGDLSDGGFILFLFPSLSLSIFYLSLDVYGQLVLVPFRKKDGPASCCGFT